MNRAATDQELIDRIAKQDRAAVEVLYARHQVRIYRFTMRFVRNEAIAEELTNEVFLDIWRLAGRFEGRSAVSTWMLAVARNKAIVFYGRNRRKALMRMRRQILQTRVTIPRLRLKKGTKE